MIRICKFILLWCCIFFIPVYANDLLIRESTEDNITIVFSPQDWKVSEKKLKDQVYFSVRFADDDFSTSPGQPMIPCRTVMLGIPLSASIDWQIMEKVAGKKISGRLLPTPTYSPSMEYAENPEFYNNLAIFPTTVIQVDQPGFIRNQRVVCLKFFPVEFSPQSDLIQLLDKIVVRINFNGSPTASSDFTAGMDETFYEGLINYEQAKKWRAESKNIKQLKKKSLLTNPWYKIFINKEGIYKVTGKMLSEYGIDITTIDPATIKIYNNGGRELSREINAPRPDSLIEHAIIVEDNLDGEFGDNDYLLFYGKAVTGWDYDPGTTSFSHYINHYVNENIYWLTWGNNTQGKRMNHVELPLDEQWSLVTSFQDHQFLEEELYNPLESGIDWYGKSFFVNSRNGVDSKNFVFYIKRPILPDTTRVKIYVVTAAGGTHKFNFSLNNISIGSTSFYSNTTKYITITSRLFSQKISNVLIDGYNQLRIEYSPEWSSGEAYLDWIELHFHRSLTAVEDVLQFYSPSQVGNYRFQLNDFTTENIFIFDVTRDDDVRLFKNSQKIEAAYFFADTVNSDEPKQYLALTADKFKSPIKIEKDISSDWRATTHQADFIIITHDDFYDQALPLKSLRENCDNLKTEVVKISDVYDEFSWGLFDPIAIRDFIKYAYESWVTPPRYVLLFGSGDYDYRNIIDAVDHNKIPPFQTTEKYEGESRAWDDWYACVSGADEYIDLAIGRLPVREPNQAQAVARKIIDYKNAPHFGDWRNTITMVADDTRGEEEWGIEREHTDEAEIMAEDYIPQSFNVNKIYLIDYPPVYTASIIGIRKPAAQNAIVESINRGSLIINYIGHGRYDLWAHEVVLDMAQDLQRISTGPKQALWIAGTCYFGRFDNPGYESMAEELVLMEGNGAIAVIAASRLVGSSPNVAFNKRLYQELLPSAYYKTRIGDAITRTKNNRGNSENDQKIIYFGDPSMHLANPSYKARITDFTPDTIKALTRLSVSGEVQKEGSLWQDFNGQILLKSYDSKKYRNYIIDSTQSISYKLPGNTIFRGTTTVNQGNFHIEFIVPKDITYGGIEGRFSLYFWNDDVDGSTFKNEITVGGTETNLFDEQGPQINLKFDGNDFENSGFSTENPQITIEITDSLSGVNIAGDIGHSIILSLDDDKVNVTDLFNYYNNNSYSGSIAYSPSTLTEGTHQIVVKAWDNSNNSSEISTEFIVVNADKLVLSRLLNYPNPVKDDTEFTFWTNQPCEVTIRIYTVAGRLIKKIDHHYAELGFNHVLWNGADEDGNQIANGLYLYKIQAKVRQNNKILSTEAIGKLMIMH